MRYPGAPARVVARTYQILTNGKLRIEETP
jgi:hypothetical protein